MHRTKNTPLLVLISCLVAASAPATQGDDFGRGLDAFTIDFVAVGNAGNQGDSGGDPSFVGKVNYEYRISTFEVSRGIVDKANRLGNLGLNPFDLFVGEDLPVVGLSWNQAARFVNWLNESEGYHPAYKFVNQPGREGYFSNEPVWKWTELDAGFDATNSLRNAFAKYALPTEDEWYKAAYYDPSQERFWLYSTGSDTPPLPVSSGTEPGTAVYRQSDGSPPAAVTSAGGLSPYGAMGMGGNVFEWNEFEFVTPNGRIVRGSRGCAWSCDQMGISSHNRAIFGQQDGHIGIGVRVVSIPEPVGLGWMVIVAISTGRSRKKRRTSRSS